MLLKELDNPFCGNSRVFARRRGTTSGRMRKPASGLWRGVPARTDTAFSILHHAAMNALFRNFGPIQVDMMSGLTSPERAGAR